MNLIVVNYGIGNITSVSLALDFLGVDHMVSGDPEELSKGDAFILPGVGAFHAGMANMVRNGIADALTEQVLIQKKPFFGICLGFQLIAKDSTEIEFTKGLGWIDGHVREIPDKPGFRVPHVGWNNIQIVDQAPLFNGLPPDANFYFDHSFHMECDRTLCSAVCEYGIGLVAAVRQDNIFAVQFHPEKSQRNGLKVLRNFLRFAEAMEGSR